MTAPIPAPIPAPAPVREVRGSPVHGSVPVAQADSSAASSSESVALDTNAFRLSMINLRGLPHECGLR